MADIIQKLGGSLIFFGANSIDFPLNIAEWLYPGNQAAMTTATERFIVMPFSGKLKNLYVRQTPGATGRLINYVVTKNSVSFGLNKIIDSASSEDQNTTDEISFVAGDKISVEINIVGAGGSTPTQITASIEVFKL